jgi:hypothetical protein
VVEEDIVRWECGEWEDGLVRYERGVLQLVCNTMVQFDLLISKTILDMYKPQASLAIPWWQ